MDYKSKYLKYKNKYLNLQKLYGGTVENKESNIINGYVNLSNKGTQNCGVYINYKDPNKILLCNYTKLSNQQLEFLNLNNTGLKIYPKFYQLYHSTDTNKYFYLWEKMDGDLRDFFLKHIPTRILKKHKPDVTEYQIKIFTDFITHKSYQDKLYVMRDDYNKQEYRLLGSYYGTNLLYKITNEQNIKHKLNIIKSFDMFLSDIDYRRIIYDILTEIEYQLHDVIKTLSYKRYLMYQNGFYSSDKKLDNIVYKIIDENKYEFYFIDPESTLEQIIVRPYAYFTPEKVFENIVDDIKSKYENFKMNDALPNIYNTFLTSMFDICDYNDNHQNTYNNLYLDYLQTEIDEERYPRNKKFINGWEFALKKFNIEKNNIFPLQIDTEEQFLQFIKN